MHQTQINSLLVFFPEEELILVHILFFESFVQTVTHLAHAKIGFKEIVKQNQNTNLFLLFLKIIGAHKSSLWSR